MSHDLGPYRCGPFADDAATNRTHNRGHDEPIRGGERRCTNCQLRKEFLRACSATPRHPTLRASPLSIWSSAISRAFPRSALSSIGIRSATQRQRKGLRSMSDAFRWNWRAWTVPMRSFRSMWPLDTIVQRAAGHAFGCRMARNAAWRRSTWIRPMCLAPMAAPLVAAPQSIQGCHHERASTRR